MQVCHSTITIFATQRKTHAASSKPHTTCHVCAPSPRPSCKQPTQNHGRATTLDTERHMNQAARAPNSIQQAPREKQQHTRTHELQNTIFTTQPRSPRTTCTTHTTSSPQTVYTQNQIKGDTYGVYTARNAAQSQHKCGIWSMRGAAKHPFNQTNQKKQKHNAQNIFSSHPKHRTQQHTPRGTHNTAKCTDQHKSRQSET